MISFDRKAFAESGDRHAERADPRLDEGIPICLRDDLKTP